MKQHSVGFYIGIIISLVVGFGIVAGVLVGFRSSGGLGYEPDSQTPLGTGVAKKTGPNTATLALQTYPDSQVCHANAGDPKVNWVTYCPTTTLKVPANSTITMVISNYDSSTPLINDYFDQVHGAIGGVEIVNNKPMNGTAATNIAHTFTLQSVPNAPYPIFVSVPIVGVATNAPNLSNGYPKPNIITFQFHTGPPGTYIWHCYDPCGDQLGRGAPYGFSGPMSTTGFMAGTLTVANY